MLHTLPVYIKTLALSRDNGALSDGQNGEGCLLDSQCRNREVKSFLSIQSIILRGNNCRGGMN